MIEMIEFINYPLIEQNYFLIMIINYLSRTTWFEIIFNLN